MVKIRSYSSTSIAFASCLFVLLAVFFLLSKSRNKDDSSTDPTPPSANLVKATSFEVPKPVYKPGEPFDLVVNLPLEKSLDRSAKAQIGRLHIMSNHRSIANWAFLNGKFSENAMSFSVQMTAPQQTGKYSFRIDWMGQTINSDTTIVVR